MSNPYQNMAHRWGFSAQETADLTPVLQLADRQAIQAVPESYLNDVGGWLAKVKGTLAGKPQSVLVYDGFRELQAGFSLAGNILARVCRGQLLSTLQSLLQGPLGRRDMTKRPVVVDADEAFQSLDSGTE